MLIDLSIPVSPQLRKRLGEGGGRISFGSMGTHLDLAGREFPLEYVRSKAVVYNVAHIRNREIETIDLDLSLLGPKMFVAFFTGWMAETKYGTDAYFEEHPQLSYDLLEALLRAEARFVGIDAPGVRRAGEQGPAAKVCSEAGCFCVDDLFNLSQVVEQENAAAFAAHVYPLNLTGSATVPCRVVAEVRGRFLSKLLES